jgi:hypothetical protein
MTANSLNLLLLLTLLSTITIFVSKISTLRDADE